MRVEQIAGILNNVNKEVIGETTIITEDLSNIVDAGNKVLDYFKDNGTQTENFDNYIGKIIDQIGRTIFVDRKYTSQAPNILKDSWEYGSIMMKVRAELMDAQDNSTWKLGQIPNNAGAGYDYIEDPSYPGDPSHATSQVKPSRLDPYILSKPNVEAKFYNKKVTYEVPITLAKEQMKEAFRSASDMSRFFSMIENRIAMKRTLCNDALIMSTIRNLIANKVADGAAVNLYTLYQASVPQAAQLSSVDDFWTSPDAIRFACKTIALYKKYMASASTLYNKGDYVTFTPANRMKMVLLSEFAKDAEVYLYSDTYHNEFDKMTGYDEVGYWQGTGTSPNSLTLRSTISGDFSTPDEKHVICGINGLVAVLFDEQACAVCCENDRVTSIYNPRAEYTNYFYKWDASYMNDLEENVVVFYVSATDDIVDTEVLPATAPADWATTYAKSSSPYYIWDTTNLVYRNLTADDQLSGTSEQQAAAWTQNYAGKLVYEKASS